MTAPTGETTVVVTPCQPSQTAEIIDLILHVQNVESNVGISIEDQPDLLDIERNYIANGGGFWVALDRDGKVVGTIALQVLTDRVAVLKKFFVSAAWRGAGKRCASRLFETLIEHAKRCGIRTIVLDTPSVATRSHQFYVRQGFLQITASELPVRYAYPNRDSLLFRLDLG